VTVMLSYCTQILAFSVINNTQRPLATTSPSHTDSEILPIIPQHTQLSWDFNSQSVLLNN